MRNKGQQQAEVHRQATELEWKIPPVVVPVVFYVIEKKLFVDLGKCQKNTAGKEQMQTERFGARPQLPAENNGYTTVFPIPEKIRVMNTKLEQNPGY